MKVGFHLDREKRARKDSGLAGGLRIVTSLMEVNPKLQTLLESGPSPCTGLVLVSERRSRRVRYASPASIQ